MKLVRVSRVLVTHVIALAFASAPASVVAQSAAIGSHAQASNAAEAYFGGAEFELGALSAPVTVVEYLSISCSHCAAFERDTWPRVESELVNSGKVRFIIREMPTAPVAASAAGFLLARCEGESRYWEIVRALLRHQDEFLAAPDTVSAISVEKNITQIDNRKAEACLSDPEAIEAINSRREAGLDAGVDSTPYFLVNGIPLKPGARLAGEVYQGGEISFAQLSDAVKHAK